MASEKKGLIYIVDMESGLADALSRRIIDMGQYLVYRGWDMKIDVEAEIKAYANVLAGVILSGSAKNVESQKYTPPSVPAHFFNLGVPVLGICYGMQYIAKVSKSEIVRCWENEQKAKRSRKERAKDQGEQGPTLLNLTEAGKQSPLFQGLGDNFPVWMKHRYMVQNLPEGWVRTAGTEKCPIAAMERGNLFCVQFHPEPHYSLFGRIIMHNFLTLACGVETPWF